MIVGDGRLLRWWPGPSLRGRRTNEIPRVLLNSSGLVPSQRKEKETFWPEKKIDFLNFNH